MTRIRPPARARREEPPRGAEISLPHRRWIAPVLTATLALGLTAGVGGHRLYVAPTVDRVPAGAPVDAVVAVGGLVETARYAQTLVQQGTAPVLVLSDPYPAGTAPAVTRACTSSPAATGYRVICFRPDPSTTRGEAQQIRDLADRNGWTRVAVVAPTFHVTRTRLLFRRCYSGALFVLALPRSFPWYNWTYQYVRQTAGFAKTAVLRDC